MTNDELQALIATEISNALGGEGSALSSERAENIRYYLGEPFGNEQDGRSQVVSTDVADTIEWMLPQLIRVFAGGDATVSFSPQGPEDVEAAEQATHYVNHIWNADNEGFLNYYTWFKDALLSKNGFLKIWWDADEEAETEAYEGLSDAELAYLMEDETLEILTHTLRTVEGDTEPVNDITLLRKGDEGRIRIEPVPPEEFLISRDAKTVEDARFVGHRQKRTVSSLIAAGYPRAIVDELPSDDPEGYIHGEEVLARDTFAGERGQGIGALDNQAMREVWVTECYVRVDLDDDGIAEMRQITVAGSDAMILSDEPWDGPRPFASLTPVIMPHRFFGRAMADLVKDLQLVKSTIMRQYLDGLYLANNPRHEVVEASIIEPSELLLARPGGVVRVKERGAITPIVTPGIGGQALEGLSYIDQVRENRTGVSPRTQGLGDNPLHPTAQGQKILLDAAQSKIELIARVFAETGVKRAFKLILQLVTRHQQKSRIVRLRNKWVPMDPRTWSNGMDLNVAVGLGTTRKEDQLQQGISLLTLQKDALELGLATPKNLLATAEIIVGAMGFKNPERFFSIPDAPDDDLPIQPAPAQPQGAEAMQMGLMQQQAAAVQGQMAMQQNKAQLEMSARAAKAQQDQEMKERELEHRFELDRLKLDHEITLKREEKAAELAIKRETARAEFMLKAEKQQAAQMPPEVLSDYMPDYAPDNTSDFVSDAEAAYAFEQGYPPLGSSLDPPGPTSLSASRRRQPRAPNGSPRAAWHQP